ncbi:IclR family transcriptional regulator [Pandoraea horticolens]|uniref:IclR family transcriptional regulator n=1 Tax=Pandoraea horticolens TaxID=2508298 RepID=A0A5E4X966_9BURK|nr:IclR family transcriptional regulator [Pandoraea horticolens]VVE32864.1 IclR family transcriptional regulator [Pandoraea horticolens]
MTAPSDVDRKPATRKAPRAKQAEAAPKRSRVGTLDRVLQILDYLYEADTPAGPYAIAKAIGAPATTVYPLIDGLLEKGLLARGPNRTVWLGPRLHYYGLAFARRTDFLTVATSQMHQLCRSLSETIQICGREGDHMVVLAAAEGPGHFRISSQVGSRVPLNWTASGRLLVGHLPQAERVALFEHCSRISPTGAAKTDARTLSKEAASAFQSRLSIAIGESDFSIACVASPICDAQGQPLATISIVLPIQKLQEDQKRYTEAVREAADAIERSIGAQDLQSLA